MVRRRRIVVRRVRRRAVVSREGCGDEDIGVEGRTVVRRGREAVVTSRTVVTMGRMSSEAAKDSGDDGKEDSGEERKENSGEEEWKEDSI